MAGKCRLGGTIAQEHPYIFILPWPQRENNLQVSEIYQTLKGSIASGQYKAGSAFRAKRIGKTFGASE